MLFQTDPEYPVWDYQQSTACGFLCWGSGCLWKGPRCAQGQLYLALDLEVDQSLKVSRDLPV